MIGRALCLALILLAGRAPAQEDGVAAARAQEGGIAAARAQEDGVAAARAAADRLAAAGERMSAAGEDAGGRIDALAETVRAYEDGLEDLRAGLAQVAARRQALQDELDARRQEIAALLGTLQVMSRAPAPMLTLHPLGPLGTARGGMLAADAAPALQARVEALRTDLAEAEELLALRGSARATLEEGLIGAQQARAALTEAAVRRDDLPRRFTEDPVQAALLIASSESLDDFLGGLGTIVDEALDADVPDASARRGSLPLPVPGEVAEVFGEGGAEGSARPGLTIAAPPRALVLSPAAATIRFRGPLLDYGNVVILEPAPDVLLILAGLAEAFGQAGQVVPEGAPIGLMGGVTPSADAILTETATGTDVMGSESLYLEVREGGSPVDPDQWFDLQAG